MAKILVIEDEPELRTNVARLLKAEGYEVLTAENGVTGVETALAQPPDLIICDIAMPGMNGLQAAQLLRARGISAPIALVTGYAELSKDDLAAGSFCGVLHKPFTIQELQGLVLRHVRAIDAQRVDAVSYLV